MALNKFTPSSPDPNITRDSDLGMAQFGHLNSIVDYINNTPAPVSSGTLSISGTGVVSSSAYQYIKDSSNANTGIYLKSGNVYVGVDPTVYNAVDPQGSSFKVISGSQSVAAFHRTGGQTNIAITPSPYTTPASAFGTGAAATAVIVGNAVNAINLTNNGSGWTNLAEVIITGGGGTGAVATATVTPKANYTSAATATSSSTTVTVNTTVGLDVNDTVTVIAGTGAFALNTRVASIIDGTTFTVNNTPTTPLSGATVRGVGGTITLVTVTNGGSGYTSAPTISFRPYYNNTPWLFGIRSGYWGNSQSVFWNGNRGILWTAAANDWGYETLSSNMRHYVDLTIDHEGSANTRGFRVGVNTINTYGNAQAITGYLNLTGSNLIYAAMSTLGSLTIRTDGTTAATKAIVIRNSGGTTPLMQLNDAGVLSLGTETPNTSAILQVDSTTQGILLPRMTTTQRTSIGTPSAGLMVYDITTNKSYTYDGTTWQAHF